ncbi:fluoride efflux transporter CrcB [Aquella oligotrophica]|uniref:Fluoride-specific ion channel FluC n=1 Tax=Aquella oligotrophica TaxID=2067065 RepID=A0A2I7N697_9NEIS|nr:fluoride efflux transporter CrcB [Aquella oligotrophica]AUR51978.1 fluoride efflux transporter CrcB [Aquella oligotrophica]
MREIMLVFFGAGIGGVLRFVLGSLVYSVTGRNFPYGTLVINLSGSFIMGFLFVLITQRYTNLAPYLIAFMLVGILGGYTTFSSFSIETLRLFQDGKIAYAFTNVLVSTIGGILLAWAGYISAQKLI